MGHTLTYEVTRDPEGNFWTVTCSCGNFQESAGSRRVARDEGRSHKQAMANKS